MPLSVMLPLVVLGIAGITLLLHIIGLSRPKLLRDAAEARAAWLDEFPGDTPERVVLSRDHRAALIETPKGMGVVWTMGADTTARYLTGAGLRHSGNGLLLTLPDYTAPKIALTLDPEEVAEWPKMIDPR